MANKIYSEKLIQLKPLLFISMLFIAFIFSSAANAQDNDLKIYAADSVDVPPTFEGGMEAYYRSLMHVRYPADAQRRNIQGKVCIGFVIEKDGKLTGMKVISGPGGGTNEEALRVVKKSRPWIPGYHKGVPVRTRYVIPISFMLSSS